MKKLLIAILSGGLFSSVALSSPCDKLVLSIAGPANYQYTLNMSKGTLNKKGTGQKSVVNKMVSTTGDIYKVYSGKGTKGDVKGSIHFTNLDNNTTVSFPFAFYSNGYSLCTISPSRNFAENANFIVLAYGSNNDFLKFQIREFR